MAYNYEYPYVDPNRYNDDWLLKTVCEVISRVEALEKWKSAHESDYEELKSLYDDIISGNFPPSVVSAFNAWMAANAIDLVGELVKTVFFGLTESGYFVAYIPESWSDIVFKTSGYDISIANIDYGHLVLLY